MICTTKNAHLDPRRRGISTLYVALMMIPLLGFVSLGADLGRVRFAKSQLQSAADASALAAAKEISAGPTQVITTATQIAAANTCAGTSIALDSTQDIAFGNWDPTARTFTAVAAGNGGPTDPRRSANAVMITARRTSSRNTALNLFFAPIVGLASPNVQASAVATISSTLPGGFIALGPPLGGSIVNLSGGCAIDSYNAAAGAYPGGPPANQNVTLVANGSINGSGGATIYGNISQLSGSTCNASYTRQLTTFSSAVAFPPDTIPTDVTSTSNNNALLPALITSQNVNLSGGQAAVLLGGASPTSPMRYYFNGINLSGGATLTINPNVKIYIDGGGLNCSGGASVIVLGQVSIYIRGDVNLSGGAIINTLALPSNLYLSIIAPGSGASANLSGGTALYAHVVAPQSAVSLSGGANFYGWIVGKSFDFSGGCRFHYDESSLGSSSKLSLVQ